MRVNLKALGLALLAAFAMSAVVATAAHATAKFTTVNEDYPVVLTGEDEAPTSETYFESTPGSRTHCPAANVRYEATVEQASTSITVTPHFGDTTDSPCVGTAGGLEPKATIHLNGCDFKFTALANTSATDTHGTADLVCPQGTEITITIVTCVVHIPPQHINHGITYTNIPGGGATPHDYITVDVNVVDTITYTETDAFLCPFNGNTTAHDGDFKASVRIKGYEDSGNKNHSTTTTEADTGKHPKQEYLHPATETDIHVK
jgi:hypothetical protein